MLMRHAERDAGGDEWPHRVPRRHHEGDGPAAAPGRPVALVVGGARRDRRPWRSRRAERGGHGAPCGSGSAEWPRRARRAHRRREGALRHAAHHRDGRQRERAHPGNATSAGSRPASSSRASCAPSRWCASTSTATRSTTARRRRRANGSCTARLPGASGGAGRDPRPRAARDHPGQRRPAVPPDLDRGGLLRRHPARPVHHARHRGAGRRGRRSGARRAGRC